MSELVEKLSSADHKVEVSIRPESTPKALAACIEKGYVHLRFPETRGGTDLYVPVDRDQCDLSKANFIDGQGQLRIVGRFSLDFVAVRCIANIDLASMDGVGRLERVEA